MNVLTTDLKGDLGVDTFLIPVPGGDCMIILLIDNPPSRPRRHLESDSDYHNDPAEVNDRKSCGTVLRAILVDGGHDAIGPGYKGHTAAQNIQDTITEIEQKYHIANYTAGDNKLKFDAWVITHWDRDHYCGGLYLLWSRTDSTGKCSLIRYDATGINSLTTLYCPTWEDTPISTKKIIRGHKSMLGSEAVQHDTKWFIYLPPKSTSPNKVLMYNLEEYRFMARSTNFGNVVCGSDSLLGLDIFTNALFSGTKPLPPTSKKYGVNSNLYHINRICGNFTRLYGQKKVNRYGLAFEYPLSETARWPILLCVGAMGNVLGSETEPIDDETTGDNYASIMMLLVWLPISPEQTPSVSLFAGGDAYKATEDLVIRFLEGLPVQVLKAGHHGARTSTSAELLKHLAPNKFLISAGKEYGHPSWQIVAFLSAYRNAQYRLAGGTQTGSENNNPFKNQPFLYKNSQIPFCHTTRFPYYFYMVGASSKVPSTVDLNLSSYIKTRSSYNSLLDQVNGCYFSVKDRIDVIVPFWLDFIINVNQEDNIYSQLAKMDTAKWIANFMYDSVTVTLDKFFYPFHLAVSDGGINGYKAKVHLVRALIAILRERFSEISPYPSDYDKAGAVRKDLRHIIIYSRFDTVLDGRVVPVGDEKKTTKFQCTAQKKKTKKKQVTTYQVSTSKPYRVPAPKASEDKEAGKNGTKTKTPKTKKTSYKRSRREYAPKTTINKRKTERAKASIKARSYPEITQEGLELYQWLSVVPGYRPGPQDEDGMVHEEDQTSGPKNAIDTISELQLVDTLRYYISFNAASKDPLRTVTFLPISEDGPQYPPLPLSVLNDNPFMMNAVHNDMPNHGSPDPLSEGVSHLDAHGGAAMMSMLAVSNTPAPTTSSAIIQIAGISYNPEYQQYLTTSDDVLFSSFVPGSASSILFSPWPGYCLHFASPVKASTTGTFSVLLAAQDQTFGMLGALLFNSIEEGSPGRGRMLRRLDLEATFLPNTSVNGAPQAQVDEMTAKLTVGRNNLVFSSKVTCINTQFGLDKTNTLGGLELRSEEALLALDLSSSQTSAPFTMADVFALAGLTPNTWIRSVLGMVPVTLASLDPTNTTTPCRNGLWLSPTNNLDMTLRLQFELSGTTKLPSLSSAAKISPKGPFLATAKRSATYSPSGNTMDVYPEVILQTTMVVGSTETGSQIAGSTQVQDAFNAYITILETSVELSVVRNDDIGSLEDLFDWIATTFVVDGFKEILDPVQTHLSTLSKTGTSDTAQSSSDSSFHWRSFTIEFDGKSVLEISICLEIGMQVGVPTGQTAGFSLDFTWQPSRWFVSGTFMPGGGNFTLGDDQYLDPTWELSDWAPPMDMNRAQSMSILYLDPTGMLKESTVPSYIPTEITVATLSVSPGGVRFSALIKSEDSVTSPSSPGSDVPMVPMAEVSLFIDATYNTLSTGPKFSFIISGTIYLPIPAQAQNTDTDVAQPMLNMTISYAGSWDFSATAANIWMGSLESLFDSGEWTDVNDFLGHIVLDTLTLRYEFKGSTASSLALNAVVVYEGYSFSLEYTRNASDKGAGWTLTMDLTDQASKGASKEPTMGSVLQWLLGDSIVDDLPDFITAASVNLNKSGFAMSLTKSTDKDSSTFILSASFSLGSLDVQFAKMRTRPLSAKKADPEDDSEDTSSVQAVQPGTQQDDTQQTSPGDGNPQQGDPEQSDSSQADNPPAKTILRISVNSLPRPPPLPLVGQMDQPFSVDFRWLGADSSSDDINTLNTSDGFKNNPLPLENDNKQGVAYAKGVSFMLLADGKPIISSKPKDLAAKPNEEAGTTNTDAGQESTTEKPSPVQSSPATATATPAESNTEPSSANLPSPSKSSVEPTSAGQPSTQESSPEESGREEPTKMKPYEKRVNGLSISNIGLDYNTADQSIEISLDAQAKLGPLNGSLVNFAMTVKLPRATQSKGLNLSDWDSLEVGLSLDGLSLGMTGDSLSVAGFLQRIDSASAQGFQGGLEVTFNPYAFTGFGSYADVVDRQGNKFISLMVYAMMQGPILKTPLVEIRGISGGFGLGSQLSLPPVTNIDSFPLLMSASPNAMEMFAELQGTSGGQQYITEVNGAMWFAVGVLGTACETVDVSAILTLALSPQVDEIAVLGTAATSFPRGQPPDKVLAFIEVDFSASADMTHGSLFVQGSISPTSFLLNSDCRPTGEFVVASWFNPSPESGDWCVSFGGWHPAFIPPAYYPAPPARLGIAWRYSSDLSITGEAYAAVTPDALMGGTALNALFSVGPVGASFDFRADFILYMHPLHYEALVHVSASVWYEISIWFIHKKLSISLGADLYISGPPFAGYVSFDVCVTTIKVRFGDQNDSKVSPLTLKKFIEVCMKKGDVAGQDEPETDHILSLEAGGIPPTAVASEPQKPSTTWKVRGSTLVFSVVSRVPASEVEVTGSAMPAWNIEGTILSQPMQLGATSPGLKAPLTVTVTPFKPNPNSPADPEVSSAPVQGFRFQTMQENVPASLW
ncbi:hypothetical protein CEP51_005300, partial [Fusarium floridanum]